ncbi:TPA: glycosyltransferase [Candidatus Avigastranaerophilus faecigallinarum]|nr:glycosyltransferase [Candidatus Avigastranaerophilus faecigallinarum]
MSLPVLAIVVPCLNEEECISSTILRLIEILFDLESKGEIDKESFVFFVNDGSSDSTWNIIEKYNKETNGKIKGISFSRNFGNQKAILAGLFEASSYNADCFISIDADLQQDETKISEFIKKYKKGSQIVAGIRNDRNADGIFKKYTALSFYKIMNLLGVKIKVNHSDYRLVSKQVVDALKKFPETNLFLRGIFNDIGFDTDYVYFDVKARKYGKTKFTPISLFSLAISGITSSSIIPLRIVTFIGFMMSLLSFILGFSAFIDKLIRHSAVPGWATIVAAIGFISGVQILCMGIIAEYLGQLFQEVKSRPRYIIEKRVN